MSNDNECADNKPQKPNPHDSSRPSISEPVRTLDENSQAASELTTRRIGQFEILEVLGEGAFGAVYHAKDTVLEREVAIKVPHASRITTHEMRQRFLREARSAAGLRHPHICPVFEVGEENDTPYIVMAFIKGQELSAVLKRRGHLTDRQAAVMVRRLALALEFAHQQGIVHRDLKPDNIMIDRERKEPVIMDFGLARRDSGKESQLTQEGQLMGTPVYMPPEQARGDIAQIGPASDIYSLGVILYELLCGCRPHEGSLAEVLSKVLTADAAPPSIIREDIAPGLEAICMKAIEREVANRYASMLEFANDLAEFLKSDGGSLTAPLQAEGEAVAEHAIPSAALAETLLVPAAEEKVAGESPPRPAGEFWIRHRVKLCSGAVAILVLAMAILWSGNGGPENVDSSESDKSSRVREFIGNSELLTGVNLSPDNQWIAASTRAGTVLVWHRDDKEPRLVDDSRKQIRMHLFSSDSLSLLVHTPGSVFELSVPDGDEKTLVTYPKSKVTPSTAIRSQSGIVFVSRVVRHRVIEYKFVIEAWRDSEVDRSVGLSAPGRLSQWGVLPESETFIAVQRESGDVCLWDFQGQLIEHGGTKLLPAEALTIPGQHGSPPTCLTWSYDERVAATSAADGSVILWDVPNRKELRRLKRHPSTVHSLALSHDGRLLLTGCGKFPNQSRRTRKD